jgi:hypothetical protein
VPRVELHSQPIGTVLEPLGNRQLLSRALEFQTRRLLHSVHGPSVRFLLDPLEIRVRNVLRLEIQELRFRFENRILEVILKNLADRLVRFDVIAEFHPQADQPAGRLGSNLRNCVLLDQQDPLAHHLGGNPV